MKPVRLIGFSWCIFLGLLSEIFKTLSLLNLSSFSKPASPAAKGGFLNSSTSSSAPSALTSEGVGFRV